jgi:SAM-dependent methyltransferase
MGDTGIWPLRWAQKKHKCDRLLAGAIGCVFPQPRSVADLGCGLGQYCEIFKSFGWPLVVGFEGTEGMGDVNMDLTEPYGGKSFDLVVCLEVGEHIPQELESGFIENLNRFSEKDIVLSWAVPGQPGSGHVNCRHNGYVIERLGKIGFSHSRKRTEFLRQHSTLSYFKNTLMVFEK